MRIDEFAFRRITIDGVVYDHAVVLDRGRVRARRKEPSKKFRNAYGHTPLSLDERLPWNCRGLVIGTGACGNLPVMKEVKPEAARRHIERVILTTPEAIRALRRPAKKTNAILHVTCQLINSRSGGRS